MKPTIRIEYCTSWGYRDKAVSLAGRLLKEHKNELDSVILVPSSGGVFEVSVDEAKVFSKKDMGRFPEEDEAEYLVREKLV